ncbi:hypothetical protein EVAR_68863_1 [Eumeta japonica]|uniref:Uncharacterized protein n=1 Tax=Eumeta variegata TaxID=151549 RepID=A0A4C1Z7N8_EUMVA|nr:hypothetical protein EVAR_68863_1 [Eumeta japonica]
MEFWTWAPAAALHPRDGGAALRAAGSNRSRSSSDDTSASYAIAYVIRFARGAISRNTDKDAVSVHALSIRKIPPLQTFISTVLTSARIFYRGRRGALEYKKPAKINICLDNGDSSSTPSKIELRWLACYFLTWNLQRPPVPRLPPTSLSLLLAHVFWVLNRRFIRHYRDTAQVGRRVEGGVRCDSCCPVLGST